MPRSNSSSSSAGADKNNNNCWDERDFGKRPHKEDAVTSRWDSTRNHLKEGEKKDNTFKPKIQVKRGGSRRGRESQVPIHKRLEEVVNKKIEK